LRQEVYFNLGFFQSDLLLTARYKYYISPKSYVARSASNTKFKQNRLVFLEMEHAGRRINLQYTCILWVDCVWNVMAHAQKPDLVFRRNGRVHLNRRGRQFNRLLDCELCTSACRVCTARASLCSAVIWRLLVTHSIPLFPLYLFSRTSPCAIT
jgi:hypothetical protein